MKKSQSKSSKTSNKELWGLFNKEIKGEEPPLECIYSATEENNREKCEICMSNLAFSEDNFLTCTNTNCGIIYKDILDHSAEWRFYGEEDSSASDPSRCGMPINPLLQESSFGCKVMNYGACSYNMRKVRRYTEWQSMPYKEKSQYNDFQTISIMARNANIPQIIIGTAMEYYKKITDTNPSLRGSNREGLLAGSIYLSCKKHGFPRDTTEIANIFHIDLSNATKGCKYAMTIITSIESDLDENEKTQWKKTTTNDFVDRYCTQLNLSALFTKLCSFVSIVIEQKKLVIANTSNATCAGIIYLVSCVFNLNISKKEIKRVTQISEVTITKCYNELNAHLDELIPKSMRTKYSNSSLTSPPPPVETSARITKSISVAVNEPTSPSPPPITTNDEH